MKRYNCYLCSHETDVRKSIHNHHIIPVEFGGSNRRFNRVQLCPNCHSRIFIEGTNGLHSGVFEDSIVIVGWRNSRCFLEYIEDGEIKYKESKKWISQMNRSSPRR